MTEQTTDITATSDGLAENDQPIALVVEHRPAIVLLDEGKRDLFFADIEKRVAKYVPDLTTAAGRAAVRSFAANITKSKTAASAAAAQLTEEWRTKTKAVNEVKKSIEERLTALATQARKPLTDWETAEEKRVEACEAALKDLTSMGVVPLSATAEQVQATIDAATAFQIDPAQFQGMTEAAIKARNHTLELLGTAMERIQQQEAERAELAALREAAAARAAEDAARAEREAAERAEREAQEAEAARIEQERVEAEQARVRAAQKAAAEAERRHQLAEQAEAKRVEDEARAVREREKAAAAAAQAAREEAEARERAHAAALAEERANSERIAQEAQADRDRLAREKEKQDAAVEAERRRIAKLEADQAHRTEAKRAVKEVLLTTGISEDQAKAIVLLIVSGEVPRVTLDWAATPVAAKMEKAA